MNKTSKFIFVMVIMVLIGVAITNLAGGNLLGVPQPTNVPFSELLTRTDIRSIEIESQSGDIFGTLSTGDKFRSQGPPSDSPYGWNSTKAKTSPNAREPIRISFTRPPALQSILGLLSMIALPLMLFALVYFMLLRPSMRR